MNRIMKGQGSVIQVVIGVLIVAGLGLFIFVTSSTTTSDTLETLGETSIVFNSRLVLSNLHEVSYFTEYGKNIDMAEIIAYGCKYGDPLRGFRYTLSDQVEIPVNTENVLETYMSQLGGNFYLEANCEEGENIEVGDAPSADVENVIAVQTSIPAIGEGTVEVNLQRW